MKVFGFEGVGEVMDLCCAVRPTFRSFRVSA